MTTPYCSLADVQAAAGGESRLRELVDYDADGALDEAAVDSRILEASAYVDGYAQGQEAVPYDPVPDTIRFLVAEETVYRLKAARGVGVQADVDKDEARRRWLVDLSRGNVTTGASPAPRTSAAHVAEAGARDLIAASDDVTMTRARLGGFW